MDQKKCVACGKWKDIARFYKSKDTYSGRRGTCDECCKKVRRKSLDKCNGFLKNLLRSARKNSKKRGHEYELEYDDILRLYDWQDGYCYYSEIFMNTQVNSDWQCSLERLNPQEGYHIENVVLCCAEFNGQAQWSVEKIEEFKTLSMMPFHEIRTLQELIPKEKNSPRLPIRHEKIDGLDFYSCNLCGELKPESAYNKLRRAGCKICLQIADVRRRRHPDAHMQKLIRSAKQSTKNFLANTKRVGDYTMDIDFDFLVHLWEKQGGLCALSNIPLNIGPMNEQDWTCSIERKDANRGYKRDNVALICVEFNTAIRSCLSEIENVRGDSGWTKEKMDYWKMFW